jgi:hypothetical protein
MATEEVDAIVVETRIVLEKLNERLHRPFKPPAEPSVANGWVRGRRPLDSSRRPTGSRLLRRRAVGAAATPSAV